jgi:arylformamidase
VSEVVYKGFRQNELEYQFNPRVSVPEYPELSKTRAAQARKVRESAKSWLDVPYGRSPREKLDIFAGDKPGGPVFVYFHGGYWRGGSKEDSCGFAPTFTARGVTVALVEYDLCPQVTVRDIVRQARSAVAWVYRNIVHYGGVAERLFVAGTSAGGHLTAMALAHDWTKQDLPRDIIKGAIVLSGVFDLDMVMHIGVQEEVQMTPEMARENSPLVHPPMARCPLLVAVGGAEPPGWHRMSEDYFAYCKAGGLIVEYLVVPGANHFTLPERFLDASSLLTLAALKLMGL